MVIAPIEKGDMYAVNTFYMTGLITKSIQEMYAELKKEIDYHLALSKIAYRRMQPFLNQIRTKLNADGLL